MNKNYNLQTCTITYDRIHSMGMSGKIVLVNFPFGLFDRDNLSLRVLIEILPDITTIYLK